jgi:hypothetical protein
MFNHNLEHNMTPNSFATTIIKGYLVELDIHADRIDCTVAYRDKSGRRYFATLDALTEHGVLEDSRCRQHRVPASIIEAITDWTYTYR